MLEYGLYEDRGVLLECTWSLNVGQERHYTKNLVDLYKFITVLDQAETAAFILGCIEIKDKEQLLVVKTNDLNTERADVYMSTDPFIKKISGRNVLLTLSKSDCQKFRGHKGQPLVVQPETFDLLDRNWFSSR